MCIRDRFCVRTSTFQHAHRSTCRVTSFSGKENGIPVCHLQPRRSALGDTHLTTQARSLRGKNDYTEQQTRQRAYSSDECTTTSVQDQAGTVVSELETVTPVSPATLQSETTVGNHSSTDEVVFPSRLFTAASSDGNVNENQRQMRRGNAATCMRTESAPAATIPDYI